MQKKLWVILIAITSGVGVASMERAYAAPPAVSADCPAAADITFSAASYTPGNTINVTAQAAGSWSLCLYGPGGRDGQTVEAASFNKSLSATATAGNWTAVITSNGNCPMDLASTVNCRSSVSVGDGGGGDGGVGGGTTTITTEIVNPLNTGDFTVLVGNVLRWLLGIAGAIALLMMIYGGITYISSAGSQQQADQGKRIVTWTIFGLLVILMSYTILEVIDNIFVK